MRLAHKGKLGLKELEERIKRRATVALSQQNRVRMRANIVNFAKSHEPAEEFGFAGLITKIRAIAEKIKPGGYFKVLLREKLMTLFEFGKTKGLFARFGQFKISRKLAAVFVCVVFVISMLMNFTLSVPRVEASTITTLQEVNGEVNVLRGAELLPGRQGLLLKPDDIIQTGTSSTAVIQFLDQSVSRLAENTEVTLSMLFANPLDKTKTNVEVVLNKGRLWARVVNLVDNLSHFQVKAENTVAVAKRKAAFDVEIIYKGKTKVSAVQNKVDLVVVNDKQVVETALVNGYSVEVKANNAVTAPTIEQSLPRDKWITDNLAQDKLYIENVKQEAQNKLKSTVKVLPGNPFYAVKELSESTSIALTLDGVEKQGKIIAAARGKFAEAEMLLEKGEKEKAAALIAEFQDNLQNVFGWLKKHETDKPEEVFTVKTKVSEVLNDYQKQMSLILPVDSLYPLKESILKMQIITAVDDPVKRTEIKLDAASEKLLEANDLAEKGNTSAATAQVEAYATTMSEVVSDIKNLPIDTKGKAVSAILDKKVDDLKVLEAMGVNASNTGTNTSIATSVDSNMPLASDETPISNESLGVSGSTSSVASLLSSGAEKNSFGEDNKKAAENLKDSLEQERKDEYFKKTVSDAKTEALMKLGEALAETQKNKPSIEVLQKLQEIKNIDINGEQVVDVTFLRNRVLIKSNNAVISVGRANRPSAAESSETAASTTTDVFIPQTIDSKIQESLPEQL